MIEKKKMMTALGLLSLPLLSFGLLQSAAAVPVGFADPAFRATWARTDFPVASHAVSRTWFWGPAPNTPGLLEPNAESPGGLRLVQYFDKSRMEINNPSGNRGDQFFVTNGLLTIELISGRMQVGASTYTNRYPACIPATGDRGEQDAPTYFALQKVSNTTLGDHPALDHMGQPVAATINRTGVVGSDPSKASTATNIAFYDTTTKHNIPGVFWRFLNSTGTVYENGRIVPAQVLINPWYYASGHPISEAYWTKATIQGHLTSVLVQMYERRALTYVPTNAQGWQVEMANIGQHYYDWRYKGEGNCSAAPQPTVQPTFAPTGTPEVTGTPATPETTATAGTPQATGTAVPTGSAVPSAQPSGTATVVEPTRTLVVATGTVVPATSPTATSTSVASPAK
ncbi:MAG: hypothetical protein ACR2M0_00600 [Chloroflexia bacterium]